ncbi:MAG: hypothetical protein P4K98_09035 [Bryobacteraceae bacterium]|nr:hypothetical protein [Bryobacteraceae bacterium]
MSVNKERPHVYVLPEDDADRQLANGFLMDPSLSKQIQVLEEAGGWVKVLDNFGSVHVREMNRWPNRFMVLLIDFDGREDRFEHAKARIPENLNDRVFILGARTEPEDLKKAKLGSYEAIGRALAKDCREDTNTAWGHRLLQNNANEIARMREQLHPILFPSA